MGNNETALEMLLLAFFVAVAVATRNDPDNGFCPAFYKVWDAYPSYDAHPSDALKEELGGDMTWMTNTCAIRTTMALRGLGIEAGDAMHTKWRDGKRRRYLIRVLEMEQYMRTVFGKPDWVGGAGIQEGRNSGGEGLYTMPKEVRGKAGVIRYSDCPWQDATGHFDVGTARRTRATAIPSSATSRRCGTCARAAASPTCRSSATTPSAPMLMTPAPPRVPLPPVSAPSAPSRRLSPSCLRALISSS